MMGAPWSDDDDFGDHVVAVGLEDAGEDLHRVLWGFWLQSRQALVKVSVGAQSCYWCGTPIDMTKRQRRSSRRPNCHAPECERAASRDRVARYRERNT